MSAILSGMREIGNQEIAIFILIGLAAAKWLPRDDILRPILLCVAIAASCHFLLFPSPDNRFFAWAYLIAGAAFIRAIPARAIHRSCSELSRRPPLILQQLPGDH